MVRSRLTFANVISCIALFVGLGGTSYAVVKVTGKNVENGSLTGKDVKNRSIAPLDLKIGALSRGPQGPAGPVGPAGPAGAPGSAAAYVHVAAAPSIAFDPARSKNATAIRIPATSNGQWCVDASVPVEHVVATPDASDHDIGVGTGVQVPSACPAGTDVYVFTTQDGGAFLSDAGFYALLN